MKRSAALPFIFVTIVLDVVAFGVIIPVLPKLVQDFMGGDTARAAAMFGVFGTVWALMQFFFSPVLGVLSDRFGRRPVILISNFGLGFDYILMALAPTVWWLFLGRIISGISGASYTTAGAYIADVTPPEKRAASYGLMGAAWGFGFILGPVLGGVLGNVNPRLPFWVAAALTLTNAVYGLFVLPESLERGRRTASFDWRRANPVGALKLLRSHRELLALAGVLFLYFTAHQAYPSVFVLYANHRYGWDSRAVGLNLASIGVCTMIVQGIVVKSFVARFGERRSMLIGVFCGALAMALFGLATTGAAFWWGIPVSAMLGLFGPAAQGIMSRHVSASEQGQLQGAQSSIMGITGLIGPALFTGTFATFIGPKRDLHLPGAPFLLASLILLLALVLVAWVTRDPSYSSDRRWWTHATASRSGS
jgi:DHA1 family tetracycline resistance protein-like MFS transporter